MKLFSVLLLVFFTGCATSGKLVYEEGLVGLFGDDVQYISKSDFFGPEVINHLTETGYIDSRGDYYLQLIMDGYYNQVRGVKETDIAEEGISLRIKKVTVKHGATINFVDPGPIYKISMIVEVFRNNQYVGSETYRTRVNMAEEVNPEKKFNWLTTAEKNNLNNQLITFEAGLRKLYRDLFFKHLDISLRL